MARETSPGLKILWVWAIGTAAVLVTSVARTRVKDMEKLMNSEEQQPTSTSTITSDSIVLDTSLESDGVASEEDKF